MHTQLLSWDCDNVGSIVVVFRWLSNEVDKNKWSCFTSNRVVWFLRFTRTALFLKEKFYMSPSHINIEILICLKNAQVRWDSRNILWTLKGIFKPSLWLDKVVCSSPVILHCKYRPCLGFHRSFQSFLLKVALGNASHKQTSTIFLLFNRLHKPIFLLHP